MHFKIKTSKVVCIQLSNKFEECFTKLTYPLGFPYDRKWINAGPKNIGLLGDDN